MATTNTMMPMPPMKTMKQRHTLTDSGSFSSPVNTVAPVAVKPLMASKYASVKLRPGMASSNGKAPKAGNTSQVSVTSK